MLVLIYKNNLDHLLRNNFVNNTVQSMNLPFGFVQITRQCLIDALVIANS